MGNQVKVIDVVGNKKRVCTKQFKSNQNHNNTLALLTLAKKVSLVAISTQRLFYFFLFQSTILTKPLPQTMIVQSQLISLGGPPSLDFSTNIILYTQCISLISSIHIILTIYLYGHLIAIDL